MEHLHFVQVTVLMEWRKKDRANGEMGKSVGLESSISVAGHVSS